MILTGWMDEATCRDCNETKPVSEFWPSELRRPRSVPRCVACARQRSNAWRAANREKARDYGRAWYARNKPQADAASAAWEKANREKRTQRLRDMRATGWKVNYDLVSRYGITVEQYQEMLNAQGGLCACCGVEGLTGRQRLYVDHCHKTGQVRGLLCRNCNAGIGFLGDSADGVRRAAAYLARSENATLLMVDGESRWVAGIGDGALH